MELEILRRGLFHKACSLQMTPFFLYYHMAAQKHRVLKMQKGRKRQQHVSRKKAKVLAETEAQEDRTPGRKGDMAVTSLLTTGVVLSGVDYAALILPLILPMIFIVQHFYLRTSTDAIPRP